MKLFLNHHNDVTLEWLDGVTHAWRHGERHRTSEIVEKFRDFFWKIFSGPLVIRCMKFNWFQQQRCIARDDFCPDNKLPFAVFQPVLLKIRWKLASQALVRLGTFVLSYSDIIIFAAMAPIATSRLRMALQVLIFFTFYGNSKICRSLPRPVK